MVLLELEPDIRGVIAEIKTTAFTNTAVIFGKDSTSCQAECMGNISGIPFTRQIQLDLYREFRMIQTSDSDQVIHAKVLEHTGGRVEQFKAKLPHIFKRI